MAKETTKRSADQLGYEEVIARLEEVVKRLEAGNLPLEESLKAFEEGVGLVRAGEAKLNEAEKRVEQLLATPQGDQCVAFPAQGNASPRRERRSLNESEITSPPDDQDVPF